MERTGNSEVVEKSAGRRRSGQRLMVLCLPCIWCGFGISMAVAQEKDMAAMVQSSVGVRQDRGADVAAEGEGVIAKVQDAASKGQDVAWVDWNRRGGAAVGRARIRVSGLGRIGPVIELADGKGSPNHSEWDTREWQWWKDCPFKAEQMRPRELAEARGGAEVMAGGVRVQSRYVCDDVETMQEWFFADIEEGNPIAYDCLITVRNLSKNALEEYGQFFASYTAWSADKGHFFWSSDDTLVNYLERGGKHLDYYVTGKGSVFEQLGYIPGCPRSGGIIKATWKHPVSISQPAEKGLRHIVMSEEARTSAVVQGMDGIAQDYVIYPPGQRLGAGESFSVHVRHVIAAVDEKDPTATLEKWWDEFAKDHARVRAMSGMKGRR